MLKEIVAALKIIGVLAIISVVIFFIVKPDIRIDSYEAIVTINDAGDMTVVERWDMYYYEEMSVRFRDIGFDKYPAGYPLDTSINNVAILDEDNISARFYKDGVDKSNLIDIGYSFNGDRDELGYRIVCEPNVASCESIFVDTRLAGGMEGQVTFEYEYTILGAITKYSDISELNWRLFTYAEAKVKEASIEVHFPENLFSVDSMYVWGHGLTSGTITKVSNTEVLMEMQNIKKNEYPEFRILVENDLFPNLNSNNRFITPYINKAILIDIEVQLAEDYNTRIDAARYLLAATIGMIVIMSSITYLIYVKYDKEYTPKFSGDYFRELPNNDSPAEVGYLYFEKKVNDETFTATLLDLIRRKYIIIDQTKGSLTGEATNFVLNLNEKANRNDLKAHENYLLMWIFKTIGDGKTVSTKQIENYGKTDEKKANSFINNAKQFVKMVKQSSEKNKYFETGFKLEKKSVNIVMLIPISFLFVSFVIGSMYSISIWIEAIASIAVLILYSIYIYRIKKRTVAGNELYTKWKAFRNFLLNFSSMDDYPIPGVIVWEHFIVYATVLEIADTVMSQLKVKLPEEELDSTNSTYLNRRTMYNRYYHGSMLHHINSSFTVGKMHSTSTIVQAKAARMSSSSGRGGGGSFGGGSSFGGGGGGGRSR